MLIYAGEAEVRQMAAISRADEADGQEIEGGTINRRSVFAGLFAALTIGQAKAAPGPREQVDIDAAALAASMKTLHGGEWRIFLDHDAGFVLIKPASI
jgi:hypothetical protein